MLQQDIFRLHRVLKIIDLLGLHFDILKQFLEFQNEMLFGIDRLLARDPGGRWISGYTRAARFHNAVRDERIAAAG